MGGAAIGALIGGRVGALIGGGMYISIQILRNLAVLWTGYLFWVPCSFSGQVQGQQPAGGAAIGGRVAVGAGAGVGGRGVRKARKGRKYSVEVVAGPFWGLDIVIHCFFFLLF